MTDEERIAYISKYPFLQVRKIDDTPVKGACYLDGMPKGWIKAFAKPMLEDFAKVMREENLDMNEVRIIDVKEKYGSLRWYWGCTHCSKKLDELTTLYEYVASAFCARCGDHPVMMTEGYILPLCKHCWEDWKKQDTFTGDDKKFTPEFPEVTSSHSENGVVIEEKLPLKKLFDRIVSAK